MELLNQIFGVGKDLNSLQMSCRGIVIFIIALILIRLSGRRSFGIKTPFDNIILILLGAILSRAVAGASPFVPTVVVSTVIVLIHRGVGHLIVRYPALSRIIGGEKILLYENDHFIQENMDKALVCREDILQGVRKSALTDKMEKIDKVYIERNGEISAIKKQEEQ